MTQIHTESVTFKVTKEMAWRINHRLEQKPLLSRSQLLRSLLDEALGQMTGVELTSWRQHQKGADHDPLQPPNPKLPDTCPSCGVSDTLSRIDDGYWCLPAQFGCGYKGTFE